MGDFGSWRRRSFKARATVGPSARGAPVEREPRHDCARQSSIGSSLRARAPAPLARKQEAAQDLGGWRAGHDRLVLDAGVQAALSPLGAERLRLPAESGAQVAGVGEEL